MQKFDATPCLFRGVLAFSLNAVRYIFLIAPAALLLFMAFARPVLAEENAGVILALTGKVEVEHEGKTLPAARMTTLYSGDSIITGDGQVQIRFADGTMLALYQDTRFAVNDYHYGKDKSDRAQFSLINGLMHTLTGHIDKRNYLLKTRLANLGVRGTEYSVKLGNVLRVSVDQGSVELANAGGKMLLEAGQSATIIGADAMSRPSTGGRISLPMNSPASHKDGEHGGSKSEGGEHGGSKLEGGEHGGNEPAGGWHGGSESEGAGFGGGEHGEGVRTPPPVGTQDFSDKHTPEPPHDESKEPEHAK